jgi:hypothetical protein
MKIKHGLLLIITTLAFITSCCYLVQTAVSQTALATRLEWGSWVLGLDITMQRIGNPTQCNGAWNCLEQICNYQRLPNVSYVLTRDFYELTNPNASCAWNMNKELAFGLEFSAFKACVAFIILGICFEVIAIIACFALQRKWLIIVLLMLPCCLLITAWVCYSVYLIRYTNSFGDAPPAYITLWSGFTAMSSWLVLLTSRSYLAYRWTSEKSSGFQALE